MGWLVVIAIFVGGLYAGFAPRGGEMPVAATVQHVGDWRVSEISARWIDNLVAGDLYVVSAVLESEDAAAGGGGDGLYVLLLDAHGEILKRPPVPVGPPLPDGLLRQVDPRDLQRVAGQARVLGPGASRRVEAVIASLPARATAFRFVTGAQLAEILAPGTHASPGTGSETLPTQQDASAAEFGEPGEVL